MNEGLIINGSSTLQEALARDAETNTVAETVATTPQENTPTETTDNNLVVNKNGNILEGVVTPEAEIESNERILDFEIPSTNGTTAETTPPTEQPSTITWQDAIKTVDKKELLKHLGIDDFAIEMNEHILRGGKPVDYLNAKAVDWNTVPDTDLLLEEMKAEFPDASLAQRQRIFNKRYSQTDAAEDDDKEDGLLLMKADARKKRADKISEQGNFKIAEPKAVETNPQPKQLTPQELEKQARLNTYFNEHESTKNLLNNKRVAVQLGEGVKPFSYNVDPKQVLGVMFDPAENAKYGLTKTGEPDIQQTYEAILFRMNPMKFKNDLINYGKGLGAKQIIMDEGQNIALPSQQTRPINSTEVDLKTLFTKPKVGTLAGKLG